MFKRKTSILVGGIVILLLLILTDKVNAQLESSGVAISVPVTESVTPGSIVCSYEEGFATCRENYDSSMYGIAVESAAIEVEDGELENSTLVVTTGVATVKVDATGGNIEDGDYITSSETSGVGIKAIRNGYVLGVAMEAYSSDTPETVGDIQVALNIHPASGLTSSGSNLLQFIREGIAIPLFEPLESLRYILAVLMVLISFTLGMVYFGKSSRTGIEAIGRNPLAKKVIQMTVILNIVLTVVIVLVGLAIAYLILIL
jgi:F0F1-type ATP synthase membrane subunit c/vacuolar-type H+-ATPase subunit K